jgi:hypothetical protein
MIVLPLLTSTSIDEIRAIMTRYAWPSCKDLKPVLLASMIEVEANSQVEEQVLG